MEKSGFFNSINGDRAYDADDFALYMKKYFTTGVFEGGFTATPATGMSITIQPGDANIEGRRFTLTEAVNLNFSVGDGNYTRIDNVVVRLDLENRKMGLMVVEGNPSGSPLAPTPTRTTNIHDIVPLQLEIPPGTSTITKAMIKDTRFDEDICGIVTGAVKQISTKELFAQYNAFFEEFMQHLKDELDKNQAGNLQNQIDGINKKLIVIDTCTDEELAAAIAASD